MNRVILYLLAAIIPLCLADHPELCSSERQAQFIEGSLTDECASVLQRLKYRFPPPQPPPPTATSSPRPTLFVPSTSDLDTACQESCSGAYSAWLRDTCEDPLTARSVDAMCVSTVETAQLGSRCRHAFPDAFNGRALFFGVFSLCDFDPSTGNCGSGERSSSANLTKICPAFQNITDTLGCCYQSLYNDTSFVNYLEAEGTINETMAEILLHFGQSPLWARCEIDSPGCESLSSSSISHVHLAGKSALLVSIMWLIMSLS